MNIKKKIKQYYKENIHCDLTFEEVKQGLEFAPVSNKTYNYGGLFMKRKLVFTLSTCFILLFIVGIIIISLGGKKPVESENIHLVQLNVNPSIQFTVDDENNVLSVYGVNDEGKMIINGEVFVGKTIDEAVELVIKLETEYGYLITGNIEAAENQIMLSVSSDIEDVTNSIKEKVNLAINKACEKYDINKVVEIAEGYTLEVLKTTALKLDPTLTEEKVNSMNYQQLLLVVENYHLEVFDYASVKLEELYQEIKLRKIEFVKTEAANTFIQKVDTTYQTIKDQYLNLYNQIEKYVNTISSKLTESYSTYFLNPESDYQKALLELETKKAELAVLEQKYANGELSKLDELAYPVTKVTLESACEALKTALEFTESTAKTFIDVVTGSLNTLVTELQQVNEQLPTEIKTSMEKTMMEVETRLNETKDQLMTDFETEYAALIQQVKLNVENRKAEIKNILAGTPT